MADDLGCIRLLVGYDPATDELILGQLRGFGNRC